MTKRKNSPKTLAIDPGSNCGWAYHDGTDVTASGVWPVKVARNESAGMRWMRLDGYLGDAIREYAPDLLVYEQSAQQRGQAAKEVYGGIVAAIQRAGEAHGLDYATVHWATVKKHATGKGNASKRAMVIAAHKRWPDVRGYFEDWPEDEADARWIADCFFQQLCGEPHSCA